MESHELLVRTKDSERFAMVVAYVHSDEPRSPKHLVVDLAAEWGVPCMEVHSLPLPPHLRTPSQQISLNRSNVREVLDEVVRHVLRTPPPAAIPPLSPASSSSSSTRSPSSAATARKHTDAVRVLRSMRAQVVSALTKVRWASLLDSLFERLPSSLG